MKKSLILGILVVCFAISANSAQKIKNEDVKGEWKYEVATAPPGYESGTLIFYLKEGKLTGKVKFADGYSVDFSKVEVENDELNFGLYVDSEYITGKVKIDGKKMKGTVNTPDGKVPLTAKKTK